MSAIYIWSLFLAIGLGTVLLRVSFIYLFGRIEMPEWLRRALRFVPAAVLAALVFPALTHPAPAGTLDISLHNVRLLAGLGGAIVAWRTRNVLLTIAIGMALLWILQFAFSL
jgi:branched-subunit amino acid transport protein